MTIFNHRTNKGCLSDSLKKTPVNINTSICSWWLTTNRSSRADRQMRARLGQYIIARSFIDPSLVNNFPNNKVALQLVWVSYRRPPAHSPVKPDDDVPMIRSIVVAAIRFVVVRRVRPGCSFWKRRGHGSSRIFICGVCE